MTATHKPVEPGQTLLQYRIIEKIGEGGMGVVWKAVDSDLDREVAIKLLPELVTADPERLARFEREARLLATLNHPRIAAVYGLHEALGQRFIAMELIEGEDLSDLLSRGRPAIEKTVELAAQIAEALEIAHEQGVIHRDLKPANVRVTPDGRIKVLDFGLAKALETGSQESSQALSLSPTMTAGTMAGVMLGTAAYMSPQQARGEPVDRRADIWSFGCVLFEMLSGTKAFESATVSDTLAAVLRSEPNLDALPADTPSRLRSLIERCLDKDARTRLRDIGEARIVLSSDLSDDSSISHQPALRPRVTSILCILSLVVGGLAGWFLRPEPEPRPERKLLLAAPTGIEGVRMTPRIAPDGRSMAYLASNQIWVQDLDSLTATPIAETEGASHIEWSPDSQTFAFVVGTKLWRTRANGEIVLIANLHAAIGAGGGIAWLDDDRIVYATGDDHLYEVPITGGRPEILVAPHRPDEVDFHEPAALPGGRVLFIVHGHDGEIDTLHAFADGERREVYSKEGVHFQRVSYSSTGHLLFGLLGSTPGLWALPFSEESLEPRGEPFRITEKGSDIRASLDASLLYSNLANSSTHQMTFVDQEGSILEPLGEPILHADNVTFSPDRKKLAVCFVDNPSDSIWIFDLERDSRSRISSTGGCGGSQGQMAWTPDGSKMAFGDREIGKIRLLRVDGSADEIQVAEGQQPTFSPDGKQMVYVILDDDGEENIWYLELEGEAEPRPLITDPGRNQTPQMAPSDALLAYVADAGSGRTEVYLQTFPDKSRAWQVSSNGGAFPRWSPDGSRLYYLQDEVKMMMVEITTEPAIRLSSPRELFVADTMVLAPNHGWDVFSEESFFMIQTSVDTVGAGDLTLITDWAH